MNQNPQKLAQELFPLTPNVVMDMTPIAGLETQCLFEVEPEEKTGGSLVSTKTLCLFENHDKNTDEDKRGLKRMRLLSTEENFFSDPWTIKKKLNITDLSLDHLLLDTSTIHDHILRYLSECDQKIVEEGWAMTVDVYDHDTDSTHQMILRKQTKHLCYVLSGGWLVDFVRRRALAIEDEIGMFWDCFHSKLHFRLLSRAPVEATYAPMDTLLPDP